MEVSTFRIRMAGDATRQVSAILTIRMPTTEQVNLQFPIHARCVRHLESQWRSTVHV